MKITLTLCCILLSFSLWAQEAAPFEMQTVYFPDGSEKQLWISLDNQSDRLLYREQPEETAAVFSAANVVSFIYGGYQYFSLPLRDGYFTFFQVLHEGSAFAVLEKKPNYKTLRIISDESDGAISMCQNRRNHEFYLCYKDNRFYSSVPNPILPNYPKQSVREFKVHKLVYLAIEGRLKLFYMETDERFNLWDNMVNPRPRKRKTEKMLEDFIEDPQKLAAIQAKVKQDKLDIRDPQALTMALEAVYQ